MKILKTALPDKECGVCNGRGYMLFADSFDSDNWAVCSVCLKKAKKLKAKLKVNYPSGTVLV